MSGNGVANLEELANARLRVTAVVLPQYNPIRPRLKPPLVEPRRFHSSASLLFPPFARHRDFDPLLVSPLVSQSFRRCTAAYNERCTPSKALCFCSLFFASRFSFLSSSSFSSTPLRCPLIFRLLFLPPASSFLPRAR